MNEFKVIDTQTGEDVTGKDEWLIDSRGELWRWSTAHHEMYDADDRYQVRRSTGISDKNGRVLFDGDWVNYCWGTAWLKRQITQAPNGSWIVSGCQVAVLAPDRIEYIEAES